MYKFKFFLLLFINIMTEKDSSKDQKAIKKSTSLPNSLNKVDNIPSYKVILVGK